MSDTQPNKLLIWSCWHTMQRGAVLPAMDNVLLAEVPWRGFQPLPQRSGVRGVSKDFWQPLPHGLRKLIRRPCHFFSKRLEGGDAVRGTGALIGAALDSKVDLLARLPSLAAQRQELVP